MNSARVSAAEFGFEPGAPGAAVVARFGFQGQLLDAGTNQGFSGGLGSGEGMPLRRRLRWSSHSIGKRYFLALLHSLQQGTIFDFDDDPPRITGTM